MGVKIVITHRVKTPSQTDCGRPLWPNCPVYATRKESRVTCQRCLTVSEKAAEKKS